MSVIYLIESDNLLEYDDSIVRTVLVCDTKETAERTIQQIYAWEKANRHRLETETFSEVCGSCPWGDDVGYDALEFIPKEKSDGDTFFNNKVFSYHACDLITGE